MIKSTDEILQSLVRKLGISPHVSKSLQDQLFELSHYRYQCLKDVLRAVFSATGTPLKSMLMLVLDDESKTLSTLSNEVNQHYLNAQTNSKIEIPTNSFVHSADMASKWQFAQKYKNGVKTYSKDIDGLTLGDPFAFFYLDLSRRETPLSNIWRLSDTRGDIDTSIATLLFMVWLSERGGRGTVREYRQEVGYFPPQPDETILGLKNAGLIEMADNKLLRVNQDMHDVSLLPRGYNLIEQILPLLELVGFYEARKKAGKMGHSVMEISIVPNYSNLLYYRRTHVDPLLTGEGYEECVMMFRRARKSIALNK